MKIFSKDQIYQGNQVTVSMQDITEIELMERTGIQLFNWLHVRMQGAQVPIHVFCGIGNNGGNGLVLARQLITHGYNVKVYVVNCSDKRTKGFLVNYDLIKQTTKKWPEMLIEGSVYPEILQEDIIVDAVFGIGLNRAIVDWVKSLFVHFRNSKAFTLSIDVPSGVYTDQPIEDENGVVWANYTLSFQSPKLIFFLPETAKFSTQWEVIDVGIEREFLFTTETESVLIAKNEVLPMYKPRDKFSHKGDFGHSMIVGGSYGKMGAAVLASRAALAIGSGLVTSFIPKDGYQILQITCPEGMVITDDNDLLISNIEYDIEPNTIGIGMGMGMDDRTMLAFESFLKANKTPLVIDADAINILSQKKGLLKLLPESSVLTPHPKELERLIGVWESDFDKLKKAKAFSKKYNIIIVIKGAHTMTVYDDKYYINTTGNPGMATAGSGDVLTGVITGLISQGYDTLVASIFGVYLHGKAADIAVERSGYQSLVASHIIDTLGAAYIDLFKPPEQPQVENADTNTEGH